MSKKIDYSTVDKLLNLSDQTRRDSNPKVTRTKTEKSGGDGV